MEDLDIKKFQESVNVLSKKIAKFVTKEEPNGVIIIDALATAASAIAMYMIAKRPDERKDVIDAMRASFNISVDVVEKNTWFI